MTFHSGSVVAGRVVLHVVPATNAIRVISGSAFGGRFGAAAVVNGARFSTAMTCFEPSGRPFTANHFVTAKSWVFAGSHTNAQRPFTGVIGEPITVPVVVWTSHMGFVSPSGSDML